MTKTYHQAVLAVVFMLLSIVSCDDDPVVPNKPVVIPVAPTSSAADTLIVTNNQESMPVWVYGNKASSYIILAVHGGPGSNVLDFRTYKGGVGFKKLEETYMVAYWQQRASGESTGLDDNNLFTIEQYVDDADKVIDEIKSQYAGKEIILFGHSWGGMLTSSYLKDATRRAKMKAWIDAAGLTNGENYLERTRAAILGEMDRRIQANDNTANWQAIKQYLSDDDNLPQANSIAYGVVEVIPEVTIKVDNSDFKFTTRALASNSVLFLEIPTTNNVSVFSSSFTLPTLILWGTYDFAVPKIIRDEIVVNMPTECVTSIEFATSGHYMMFHEPSLFAGSISNFIENLP